MSAARLYPQLPQYFCPTLTDFLQDEQLSHNVKPQLEQNLTASPFAAPQLGHASGVSLDVVVSTVLIMIPCIVELLSIETAAGR